MAENKKSVILYVDIIHTVESLEDDEAGRLFKHFLRYVNDHNPTAPDKLTQVVFEPIKQQLKRDLIKYEEKKILWSEAGKASADAKKKAKLESKQTLTSVDSVQQTSTESTVSVNDNVINNNISSSKEEVLREDFSEKIEWVITKLNKHANTDFTLKNKANNEFIIARIKEGREAKDFLHVITVKSKEWLGTEHEKYLRPSTLFNVNKFENYLQQKDFTPVNKPNPHDAPKPTMSLTIDPSK